MNPLHHCIVFYSRVQCSTGWYNALQYSAIQYSPTLNSFLDLFCRAQISDVKGSLQRTFLSPAALRAARVIDSWMQDAGMRTWTDGVGNVHGRLDGSNPSAPALLIGSHMVCTGQLLEVSVPNKCCQCHCKHCQCYCTVPDCSNPSAPSLLIGSHMVCMVSIVNDILYFTYCGVLFRTDLYRPVGGCRTQ